VRSGGCAFDLIIDILSPIGVFRSFGKICPNGIFRSA
jgi:hypothetical protein